MKRKVPTYPPIIDEYCITTTSQTHTNRDKQGEPVIKTRCIKKNLEVVFNRKNPWNKLEGYYYEEYIGSDSLKHIDTMQNSLEFSRIDLGQQASEFYDKTKTSLKRIWSPGVDMSRKIVTGDINLTPIFDNAGNATKIWHKIYDFWTNEKTH